LFSPLGIRGRTWREGDEGDPALDMLTENGSRGVGEDLTPALTRRQNNLVLENYYATAFLFFCLLIDSIPSFGIFSGKHNLAYLTRCHIKPISSSITK
jgi:hypothetical protein